jgi:hypothetical protein
MGALWICLALAQGAVQAQTLPPHRPLRIAIVSDEVNPHALPPELLTQPGDISAALLATPALNRAVAADAIVEIPTDEIEQVTALLQRPRGAPDAYDALIYFSHRIPTGADAQARQEAFVAALDAFLAAGGGLVSFHHGLYYSAGKESMQALLGAQATGPVPYDTVSGQNVIDVAPMHFVTTNGLAYPQTLPYADAAFGVPPGTYGYFNNTPDERYPDVQLLPTTGIRTPLFASDYDDNGSTHVLAFTHRLPHWAGIAVVYQPGEYQPHALGASNANFQVLLNAIVFAATFGDGDRLFADGFEAPPPSATP